MEDVDPPVPPPVGVPEIPQGWVSVDLDDFPQAELQSIGLEPDEERRFNALGLAVTYLAPKAQTWSGQDIVELARDFHAYIVGRDETA